MKCITETEYTLHLVSNDLLLLHLSPDVLYSIASDRYGKKKKKNQQQFDSMPSILVFAGKSETNMHIWMVLSESRLSCH